MIVRSTRGKYRRFTDTSRRKQSIIEAAVELSQAVGFSSITRDGVAKRAKISGGLINFHFGAMDKFRKEIIRYVIAHELLPIVIQAIGQGDLKIEKLPPSLKKKVADYISNHS